MTVIVRRPGPPLDRLVRAITYQAGEQPQTAVEKLLPGAGTSAWVNLNTDEFRSFGWTGRVNRVPGAMLAGPASRARVLEFEQGRAHVWVAFALGAAGCFFAAPLGLAKRFARVQRLQRVARDLDGRTQADWAALAAAHGYADQPHLADEFRELVGVTPTGYLGSRVNGPNHLRFPV